MVLLLVWGLCVFSGQERNNMDIFSPLFLLLCFFVALFTAYSLANDDFVLLRRHVSITNVFNIAFVTFFIGLFSARVIYVVFNFSAGFLNPLVFFLFPYFPGLYLGGGMVGAMLFLYFYLSITKFPKERICDVFSIALFSTLPIGLLMLATIGKKTLTVIFSEIILTVVSFVFLLFLLRFFQKGVVRDGSISFLSLSLFSLISFLAEFLIIRQRVFFFFSIDQLLLFGLFIFFTGMFVWQEYFPFRKKIL